MSTGIIFGNRILDVAVIACFAAQFYKVFSPLFKGRGASWVRLFQTGGMPSSHASTVVALATSLALLKGMRSVEFAISMVFSSIVLYDATGIRRAAGEHAKALNRLVKSIEHKDDFEKIWGFRNIRLTYRNYWSYYLHDISTKNNLKCITGIKERIH